MIRRSNRRIKKQISSDLEVLVRDGTITRLQAETLMQSQTETKQPETLMQAQTETKRPDKLNLLASAAQKVVSFVIRPKTEALTTLEASYLQQLGSSAAFQVPVNHVTPVPNINIQAQAQAQAQPQAVARPVAQARAQPAAVLAAQPVARPAAVLAAQPAVPSLEKQLQSIDDKRLLYQMKSGVEKRLDEVMGIECHDRSTRVDDFVIQEMQCSRATQTKEAFGIMRPIDGPHIVFDNESFKQLERSKKMVRYVCKKLQSMQVPRMTLKRVDGECRIKEQNFKHLDNAIRTAFECKNVAEQIEIKTNVNKDPRHVLMSRKRYKELHQMKLEASNLKSTYLQLLEKQEEKRKDLEQREASLAVKLKQDEIWKRQMIRDNDRTLAKLRLLEKSKGIIPNKTIFLKHKTDDDLDYEIWRAEVTEPKPDMLYESGVAIARRTARRLAEESRKRKNCFAILPNAKRVRVRVRRPDPDFNQREARKQRRERAKRAAELAAKQKTKKAQQEAEKAAQQQAEKAAQLAANQQAEKAAELAAKQQAEKAAELAAKQEAEKAAKQQAELQSHSPALVHNNMI